jgi:hypothetical protein
MSIRLEDDLAAAGYEGTVDEFRDRLVDIMFNMHPEMTVDQLIVDTGEAEHFCNHVRYRCRVKVLPNRIILSALLNLRKAGRFSPTADK